MRSTKPWESAPGRAIHGRHAFPVLETRRSFVGSRGRRPAAAGRSGKDPTKDLKSTKLPRTEIEKAIADGRGKMPAFRGKLSHEEIAALSRYIADGLR